MEVKQVIGKTPSRGWVLTRKAGALLLWLAALLLFVFGGLVCWYNPTYPDASGWAAWAQFLGHFWPALLAIVFLVVAGWYVVPEPRRENIWGRPQQTAAHKPITPAEGRRFAVGLVAFSSLMLVPVFIGLIRHSHHTLSDPWRMLVAAAILLDLSLLIVCGYFAIRVGLPGAVWPFFSLPSIALQTFDRLDILAAELRQGRLSFDVLYLVLPVIMIWPLWTFIRSNGSSSVRLNRMR